MTEYSISPSGEKFKLPDKKDYVEELKRLEKLAKAARKNGQEVIVVMGLGFVGAVMAAIVADTVDKKPASRLSSSSVASGPARAATGKFP